VSNIYREIRRETALTFIMSLLFRSLSAISSAWVFPPSTEASECAAWLAQT